MTSKAAFAVFSLLLLHAVLSKYLLIQIDGRKSNEIGYRKSNAVARGKYNSSTSKQKLSVVSIMNNYFVKKSLKI